MATAKNDAIGRLFSWRGAAGLGLAQPTTMTHANKTRAESFGSPSTTRSRSLPRLTQSVAHSLTHSVTFLFILGLLTAAASCGASCRMG